LTLGVRLDLIIVSAVVAEQLIERGQCDSGRSTDPRGCLSEQLPSDDKNHVLLCLASPGSLEACKGILVYKV